MKNNWEANVDFTNHSGHTYCVPRTLSDLVYYVLVFIISEGNMLTNNYIKLTMASSEYYKMETKIFFVGRIIVVSQCDDSEKFQKA